MKKNRYISLLMILICNLSIKGSTYLYIQNDTSKPIQFDRNNSGILYDLKPGTRKPTPAEFLKSIYAKYLGSKIYRKLNLGNVIKDAQKEGISAIIHIIPGTLFGVKVGSIEKRYDIITIPLNAKMEVLKPLGLTLQAVDIPKFSKELAAKILGIPSSSTAQQAETTYVNLAQQDKGKSDDVAYYRGYLLTKALRAFKA